MKLEDSLQRSQESASEPRKGQIKPRSPEPRSLRQFLITSSLSASGLQSGFFLSSVSANTSYVILVALMRAISDARLIFVDILCLILLR